SPRTCTAEQLPGWHVLYPAACRPGTMSTVSSTHDRRSVGPFAGHPGPVLSVAVTPDGEEIITAGEDRTAWVWNRRTAENRTTLTGHTSRVWSVAVTPDGEEIITAGYDGTARVWNRRTGEHRTTLTGHTSRVWSVAVTPDGEEIIT